jgi:hypothetical protein
MINNNRSKTIDEKHFPIQKIEEGENRPTKKDVTLIW